MNSIEHALPRGYVLELQLDRPAAHHALDADTLAQLRDACTAHASRDELRAVLLTSTGPSFAAGGDLREIRGLLADPTGADQVLDAGRDALRALGALPVPVVAALDGAALGGGAELALAADVRFAGPAASLALRQVHMALAPAWDTSARLSQLVGYAPAAELLLLGERIDAARMITLGLARPAPRGARVEALEWALALAEVPPKALRANVALLRAAYAGSAEQNERERRVFASLFGQAEHREALAAFFEKRAPRY